jgi:hypothetical protein
MLGWSLDDALDLRLVVDGRPVAPIIRGSSCRFVVPAGAQAAFLDSSASRPSHVGDSRDQRDLGVCVSAIAFLDGFGAERAVDLSDPQLDSCGFHPLENGSCRWTAGRAEIPSAYLRDCQDGGFLRVEICAPIIPRWAAPIEERRRAASAA